MLKNKFRKYFFYSIFNLVNLGSSQHGRKTDGKKKNEKCEFCKKPFRLHFGCLKHQEKCAKNPQNA